MIHSEAERQFYLGAAGIRLWYAREALPGAAASPDFDFSDDVPESALWPSDTPASDTPGRPSPVPGPSQPSGRSGPGAGARVANLQALMDDAAAPAVQPGSQTAVSEQVGAGDRAEPDAPVAESEPEQPVGLVPRLDLQIWRAGQSAIVASLSDEASLRLQETLASNILKSLGEADFETLGPVRWPLFNNVKAPGNSMTDLQTLLNQELAGLGERRLIVLGLTPPEGFSGDVSRFTHISGVSATVNFPHSLAELATSPDLKRALWQELKPLAKA